MYSLVTWCASKQLQLIMVFNSTPIGQKIFLDLYDVYVRFSTTYHPETKWSYRKTEIKKLENYYLDFFGNKQKEIGQSLYLLLYGLFVQPKKFRLLITLSFELVYGREDQQPFDIAARPTKGCKQIFG